ncbi:MAG: SEL1-like repeat protein [Tidjanibacter sp.]|nr:SEL1-like repeat protein [Tidjanibacter sp.]
MKTHLRLTLALGLMLMLPLSIAAQSHTMTVDGTIVEDATDLDAQTYYPKWDVNDELCALLKVTIIGTLPEPLMLDVRGVGVTDRVERSNGEIWFYLPHHAKNLLFSCKGLEPLEPIAVRLREGRVYKMRIRANSHSQVVTNATPTSNYLKMILSEAGATVSLGKTPEYELVGRIVEGKLFSMRLNHGTYYYRVEHPLCQTATGVVTVGAESNEVAITLQPAWGQLSIDSTPSGATLYINGRRIGTTPCSPEEKFAQGTVEVRLLHNDYHPLTRTLTIAGNGERHSYTFELRPQFGTATVSCPDGEAEIWIDNEYKGKGHWTGTLNSLSSHLVESRRAGHIGQSVELQVADGQRTSIEVGGPVAMYGTLDLAVEPELASVEIDGKAVGTAPLMVQLTATTHKVRLTAEGYHPDEFEVTIGHNSTTTLSRTLTSIEYSPEDLFRKARSIDYNKKEERFKWYLKAAKLGHAEAQAELGLCYHIGSGVEKNENEAAKWYLKAAEQDNPKAQVNLAHFYQYGIGGLEESESKSAEWVRKAAEQGYPEGQRKLGSHYHIGIGVEKNFEMAVYWYRKGAEQGDGLCRQSLAECYQKGEGVQKNINEALKWYKAILYDKGYTSSYTVEKLLSQHYSGAAQRGDAEAQFIMGCIQGQFDKENRIRWFLSAAKQGHIEAQYRLGQAYVNDSDYEEAKKWLLRAAEKGHTNAQYELAGLLGLTVEQQAEWTYKAAIKGHVEAQRSLGGKYFFGNGVTKDVNEAVKWYRKAAEQGDEYAKDKLWELGERW